MFRVMLVDDNPDDLNGLRYFFPWKDLDCTVVAAVSNGAQGIETARTCKPDIIITDISMPQVDGIRMTEQILSFLPDVHFIYTSCFNDFDFAQQALRLGVSSYITKPIDFDELTKSIIRVISQREEDVKRKLLECDLRKQLKTHRSDLIEHFFTDLLFKISMDPGSLKYRAQYLEIPLDGQFRLVVLQVDHEYQDNIDARYLHNQYLRKLFEESFLCRCTGYIFSHDLSFLILILQGEMSDSDLLSALEELQQTFHADIERSVTICMDKPQALCALPESFRKLMETLKNESFHKNGKIFTATDIELCSDNAAPSSFDEIYTDIQNIFHAESTPQDFIQKYYPDASRLTELQAKLLSFYILYSIHLYLSEQNKSFQDLFGADFNIWEKLDHYKSIHNLKQWIENILAMTRDYLQTAETSQAELIATQIKEQINQNFSSIQGLDQVVAPLYISLSHARRVFKQVTGETIFNYLLKTRMEHAKEYLDNKDYKIYQVGKMVGYSNTSYFTSAFRHYTGLTPQEYRYRKMG